jgi:hypothetical protein
LAALRAKPGVSITQQDGWTIAEDRENDTVWSFTPSDHPAHPAAIKRALVKTGDTISLVMSAKCGASKAACDKLIDEFRAMNERVRENLQGNDPGTR